MQVFYLKDIRLTVDDQYYPVKSPLNLDVRTNDVNELLEMYQKITSGSVPQYTTYEYLKIHGIVCFDLEAQKENKARIGLKQILSITKDGDQALDIHCLILEENFSIVKPDGTTVTNIPL